MLVGVSPRLQCPVRLTLTNEVQQVDAGNDTGHHYIVHNVMYIRLLSLLRLVCVGKLYMLHTCACMSSLSTALEAFLFNNNNIHQYTVQYTHTYVS